MKPKIYLETTLFNYYFLEDITRQAEIDATKELFEEIKKKNFVAYVSDTVIVELDACPEPKRTNMLSLVKKFRVQELAKRTEVAALAREYIHQKLIPKRKEADAIHIASAVCAGLNILVSWNCRHIVRPEIEDKIEAVNVLNGYGKIHLCTPLEVISYGEK